MKKFLIILLTALTLFAGCDQGTNDSKYDLTKLDAKINEANSAKEGVQEATSAGEVPQGLKWVTKEEMLSFAEAIGLAVVTRNFPTSQKAVDIAVINLNEAITEFNSKKQDGTATPSRSIVIIGLNPATYPNGTEIQAGVFETNSIDLSVTPEIYGSGTINNGQATVVFKSNNQTTLWVGEGSYYVGFMVKEELYISKSKIAFSSTAYKPSVTYLDFNPSNYAYEYKCGDLAAAMGGTIPANATLNDLCLSMTGNTMNYVQLMANNVLPGPFYKDKDCTPTQAYVGNEIITADTMLYCKFNLSEIMGNAGNSH